MTDRNYVKGNWKKIDFDNGGYVINFSLNVEDLKRLPNNKWYVKLCISNRKNTDEYGNNITIYENTYKKQNKEPENTTNDIQDAWDDLSF